MRAELTNLNNCGTLFKPRRRQLIMQIYVHFKRSAVSLEYCAFGCTPNMHPCFTDMSI